MNPPDGFRDLIGALTDVEDREWFDSAFLEALIPASVRVALQDGEKQQQLLGIR